MMDHNGPSPAPWALSGSLIVNEAGTVIARVTSSYNRDGYGENMPPDWHINAPQWTGGAEVNGRLLVAAPALLAALERLVGAIMAENGADLLPVSAEWDPEHYAAVQAARGALLAAKGEA